MKTLISTAVVVLIAVALGALFISQTTLMAATSDCFTWIAKNKTCSVVFGAIILLIVIFTTALLFASGRKDTRPRIPDLPPSFFFWLGMGYLLVLLVIAGFYVQVQDPRQPPLLLGGILPIGVPWFGAVGAVLISLEGIFAYGQNGWNPKYNFWHIGRPLFGAVLGIVAFFTYVLIVISSGSTPAFLEDSATVATNNVAANVHNRPRDYIIYYIVAFLVGYREETFRELMKRVTDLILKPPSGSTDVPEILFKRTDTGAAAATLDFGQIQAGTARTLTVEIQNSGKVVLMSSGATLDPSSSPVFALANNRLVSGSELKPGEVKSVDITFTPTTAGVFKAILVVTGSNSNTPAKLPITGQA